MLERILDVAKEFFGEQLTEAEGERLALFCEAALGYWSAALLPELKADDCAVALVPAAAWTALASFLTARGVTKPWTSFSAGEVSVRYDAQGQKALRSELLERAERLMSPYTKDASFAFLGVRG